MASKILLYCTQLLDSGGIENHILEFTEKMAASGTEIDIVVPNFKMGPASENRIKKCCNRSFLNKTEIGKKRWMWLSSKLLSLGYVRYQSLYTNGQGESIDIVSKLIRFKNWVHHHHTSGDTDDMNSWGNRYKRSLQKADRVIACSGINAQRIELHINRKIEVVSCFSRKIDLSQNRRRNKTINLGYFGRLIPEKGIDTICRLSEDPECSHIKFHLWGEGAVYPAQYFQQFPKLSYHGSFHTEEELKKVLEFLDGFLLISTHSEGLPISLLENMSAGVPWLATDKGGIPDIAFDPVSTRVISHKSTYCEIKEAVLLFASDLAVGKIKWDQQKALYRRLFASEILVSQWKSILV